MQIPYRAEFFDRQLNYKFFSVVEQPEIKMDYLTLDKTSLTVPSVIEIDRGWFCRIVRGANQVFQGIVASVSQSRSSTTITLSPMIALFDTQVYKDRTSYNKTDIEGWIAGILRENFSVHNGVDGVVENIQGFTVTTNSSTNGVALSLDDNIHYFWSEIATKAIENGKVAIECSFDPMLKTVSATVKSFAAVSEITLESDLPNVISRNFTMGDRLGGPNKAMIINQDNESQQQFFFSSDYAPPTVLNIERITVKTGKTFAETASERASEILNTSEFNSLIELQYREDDMIVPEIKIGQPCRILKSNLIYHSVLTGITLKGGIKTLIFGGVRVNLTQKLKLKGAI